MTETLLADDEPEVTMDEALVRLIVELGATPIPWSADD